MLLLHADFYKVKALLYDKQGFAVSNMQSETEGLEYGACRFTLNAQRVIFRAAKITPKKQGLFVAIWTRGSDGATRPFDSSDDFDLMVITVTIGANFGQFVFPKSVLEAHGVISHNSIGGKRGIRVYPPWVSNLNKQAGQTQEWQTAYYEAIG